MSERKIESSQLQVLVALSQNEGLSKAAQALGVTQSAVSQSVKAMETKLGFPVVSKNGKNLVLTENGKKLAKVAKMYFRRIEDAIEQVYQENNRIAGQLTLGTLYGLGKSWVISHLIDFLKGYPELELKIVLDFPNVLTAKFESGEIDCLMMPDYLIPHHVESMPIHDEYSTLVFPDSPNFPITLGTQLDEIQKYPVLMFENHDPLFFRWCRERFKNVPKNLTTKFVANSFGHLLQGVHEELGIAVVPTHVLQRSYFKDKLKTLGKQAVVKNNTIAFALRTDELDNKKVNCIYQFLKEHAPNEG